jgi:hypothetical protein
VKSGGGKVEATQHNTGANSGLDDSEGKEGERCLAVPFQFGVDEDGSGKGRDRANYEVCQEPVWIMNQLRSRQQCQQQTDNHHARLQQSCLKEEYPETVIFL